MIRKMLVLVCLFAFSVFMADSSEAFEPESILGVWLFDESKGNEVMDSSEKGHKGNITNNDVKWVDGKFGDALEFVGGGKVEVPHADEFTTPTFTLMAWIKVDKPNNQWQLTLGKDGWPDRNYGMFVAKDSGMMHYAFCAPGQQDAGNFNTPTIVADGEWHHLAMTYDLKARRAYIDGNVDAEKALAVEPSENNVSIEIGRNFTGLIDEVLLANEAFSEDDIKSAMEVGLSEFIGGGGAVSASGKLASIWAEIRVSR